MLNDLLLVFYSAKYCQTLLTCLITKLSSAGGIRPTSDWPFIVLYWSDLFCLRFLCEGGRWCVIMGESWRELSTKCSVCVECSSLLPSAGWSWRLETGRYLLVPWGTYCRQSNIRHSRRQDDIWFRFRHQQQHRFGESVQ